MKSKMENAHAGADILAFFSRMLKNGHMQRKFPLFGPPQTMERYYDGVFCSYIDQIFDHNLVIFHAPGRLILRLPKSWGANEVVGGRKNENHSTKSRPRCLVLRKPTNGFQPAERVLDLLHRGSVRFSRLNPTSPVSSGP
jgi:hypothetical protein